MERQTLPVLGSGRSPEWLYQALLYHIQRPLVHTRPAVIEVLVEERSGLVGFKRLLKSDDLLRGSAQIVVQADTQTRVERRTQRCRFLNHRDLDAAVKYIRQNLRPQLTLRSAACEDDFLENTPGQ